MNDSTRYTVLVAVDGTDASLMVLEQAINVAARYSAVDFQVASVLEPAGWLKKEIDDDKVRALERQLAEYLGESLNNFDGLDISDWRLRLLTRAGDIREELVFLAEWGQADLVVVGRSHLSGALASSGTSDAIIAGVNCPVLVVKPKEHRPTQDVEYTGSGRVLTMSAWMAPGTFTSSVV